MENFPEKIFSNFAENEEWQSNEIEYVSHASYMDVTASFYEQVFFMIELSSYTNKGTQHTEYLRQLALETIHQIPCDDLQI
ncbi:UNVERIFIED_CONTAM: hypothetical protein NCL1_27868 [Trichonephila clavipes]